MKRTIALLLTLAMLFALCACGKTEEEIRGAVTAISEEPKAEEAAPSETEETTAESAEEAPIEDVEVKLGLVEGGRYESEFLGIGCELDENWTYASIEEMAQIMGMTTEVFAETDYAESIKSAEMFYDMYAARTDGLGSINILLQNMGLLYGAVISEEQYVDLSTESLSSQLESAGFANVEWERVELDFAGESRPGLKISSEIEGVPYYCTQVYIKSGSHIAVITLATYFEDTTESMADYFFAVE